MLISENPLAWISAIAASYSLLFVCVPKNRIFRSVTVELKILIHAMGHGGYKVGKNIQITDIADLNRRMRIAGRETHFQTGDSVLFKLQISSVRDDPE